MAKRSFSFATTFLALFALSFAFLAAVDALPEPLSQNPPAQKSSDLLSGQDPQSPAGQTFGQQDSASALPIRIVAKSIGMDNTVLNPQSTAIDTLDAALLKGTVRYPGSALLGVDGTVLIFGHSSYLPIVRNQNYKAFNGIQKLKPGQIVSVYSATTEYRYTVTSVRLANASEDVVELPSNGKFLKLITCDTFGAKSDRFVVAAEFTGAYER